MGMVTMYSIGVGSTGAPGAGAPLYFFQLTSILVHLLQALIYISTSPTSAEFFGALLID